MTPSGLFATRPAIPDEGRPTRLIALRGRRPASPCCWCCFLLPGTTRLRGLLCPMLYPATERVSPPSSSGSSCLSSSTSLWPIPPSRSTSAAASSTYNSVRPASLLLSPSFSSIHETSACGWSPTQVCCAELRGIASMYCFFLVDAAAARISRSLGR
ncbi:hypothetical protein K437DRAFT_89863 [Tilletiaria anomala UBC 951]|uniref:Uncharacterized protein n=1 Tax=Tilletiaria anomala (strain ATCC 24038 / CBS 436.72 / UBC 951) TaxID=1037660 RepID=A0A066W1X1_TILAU|nr:uncharacterized protein K437DRAFT_89863 [Tilletiaria anomala UBC 951]KDN47947.1 hypothetical protein K437DRAFT_89863 [Tilletiaria anomala UBC 951]